MLYFLYFCSIFFFNDPESLLLLLEPGRSTGMTVLPSWIEFSEQWLCSLRSEPLSYPRRVLVTSWVQTASHPRMTCTHSLTICRTSSLYFHITGILMIFQSLERNKLCNNLKSHLFREKATLISCKWKKNACHQLGSNDWFPIHW